MPRVIGATFREAGKIYYFEIDEDIDILPGDNIIVKTSQGTEFAEVISPPENILRSETVTQLKKIIRKATLEDLEKQEELKALEKEGMQICKEKIKKHGLEMKLVDVELIFDESKMIFYFCAESRIDFRELVRDLASNLKRRIELKQIGVRDEAKMIGGLGCCGRRLCCNSFLKDFEPVSIKLAKEQNLPLNPFKISGVCGRLMCCLRYEYNNYKDFNKNAPRRGESVRTADFKGVVCDYNVCKNSVVVENSEGIRREIPLDEIKRRSDKKNKLL